MKKMFLTVALFVVALFVAEQGFSHTPLCSCMDNGDGSVTCQGGFSDGSSASGVTMKVVDTSGKTLITGKMNENSEFTFKKSGGDYKVQFDAGPGHLVEITSKDISR